MKNKNKYIDQAQSWINKSEQKRFHNIKVSAILVLAEYLAQQNNETIFKKEK